MKFLHKFCAENPAVEKLTRKKTLKRGKVSDQRRAESDSSDMSQKGGKRLYNNRRVTVKGADGSYFDGYDKERMEELAKNSSTFMNPEELRLFVEAMAKPDAIKSMREQI